MLETKIQTENSCICEDSDEEFSGIEKELEEKLWELHDIAINKEKNC